MPLPTEPSIRLVVNADGFGASPEISSGILRAHHEGIVTSTSIHGNCAEPAETLREQLRSAPELGVGLHAVLIGGRPVSPPDDVRSLVTPSGTLVSTPAEFVRRWARGLLVQDHLERELRAQAGRLLEADIRLDHMNANLHLGFLPQVARAMEAVAVSARIDTLRTAIERPSLSWFTDIESGAPLAALRGLSWWSHRHMGSRRHGPQSWGFAESGDLGPMRILEIVGKLDPGIHELICHPGEVDTEELMLTGRPRTFHRRVELEGLTAASVREALARRNIALCRFCDLFSPPPA